MSKMEKALLLLVAVMLIGSVMHAQTPGGGPASDRDIPAPRVGQQPQAEIVQQRRQASLSLSPAVVMTKGSFGQSITQTLTLVNDTPRELSFDMVAQDAIVRDGKRVFVNAGELPGSIAATAVFSTPTVTMKPWTTTNVDVRFTMPEGSPIRAVVAIFRGTNRMPSGLGSVAMTASLGTLITFTMSDDFRMAAEPIAVTAQSAQANLAVSEWLTNQGAEPIVPEGMAVLLAPDGSLVSTVAVPAQRLLPGEHLQFKAEWPEPIPPGKYRVLMSYKFEGKLETKSSEVVVQ